ncbi:MAG: 3'-5' exonuclease [Planctomycetes bacterium]|nr:3'-5' exonuclease [Planctomycetota bacterium]
MDELSSLTYSVIDTETTSSGDYNSNKICEIAVIKIKANSIIDEFNSLINPCIPISPEATTIHRITNNDVATSPKFSDVSSRIHRMVNNTIFVCHNTSFDLPIIVKEFSETGIYIPGITSLDTVKLSRKAFPGLKSYSLQSLISHLGINRNRSHRAYDDCKATVELFILCMKQLRTRGFGGIQKLLSIGANRKLHLIFSEINSKRWKTGKIAGSFNI